MSGVYQEFVRKKLVVGRSNAGFALTEDKLSDKLRPWQRELVLWALAAGKAALFEDCGLGKTFQQLEWARHAAARCESRWRAGRALILAPLAVAQQTIREGAKFGIEVRYAREASEVAGPITITNYERLERFDPKVFCAVVLDESGIIKNYSGKLKQRIFAAFRDTPLKLACTATPAPNDHMELGQHAEFLDVLTSHEMLARWFINDAAAFGTYRLKGHAARDFWDWTCSWARYVGTPADLGYPADGYELPGLEIKRHIVDVDVLADRGNELFRTPDLSATSVHHEKRRSIHARAERVGELVMAEPGEDWVVWCETDYEERALKEALPFAVAVNGKDTLEEKEAAAKWFVEDRICTCPGRISRPTRNGTTCDPGTSAIEPTSPSIERSTASSATSDDAPSMPTTKSNSSKRARPPKTGRSETQSVASRSGSSHSGSPSPTSGASSPSKADAALSAEPSTAIAGSIGSPSTIATRPGASADCSAETATRASASSPTILIVSSEQRCTCAASRGRVLITKSTIFGYGLNWQHCARMAFVGPSFSYERFYQAVRRCHRFGQKRTVHAHVVMAQTEAPVWNILTRKSDDHESMAREMFAATRRAMAVVDDRAQPYEPRGQWELASWIHSREQR